MGPRTRVWAFAHVLEGAVIGADCNLGDHSYVEAGAVVGDNVTIKNGVQVWEGVTIEDDVFIGPNAVFTNDFRPRAFLKKERDLMTTLVRRGATVGANATVVCGVTIGTHAFIAAGTVVRSDAPAHALVAGNPGTQKGWVCTCASALTDSFECESCGSRFRLVDPQTGLDEMDGNQ